MGQPVVGGNARGLLWPLVSINGTGAGGVTGLLLAHATAAACGLIALAMILSAIVMIVKIRTDRPIARVEAETKAKLAKRMRRKPERALQLMMLDGLRTSSKSDIHALQKDIVELLTHSDPRKEAPDEPVTALRDVTPALGAQVSDAEIQAMVVGQVGPVSEALIAVGR